MSSQQFSLNEDLVRLRNEGYDVEVLDKKYLLVKDVPYVTAKKEIKYGVLVSVLTVSGDVIGPPGNHVAYFVGEAPCDSEGAELKKVKNPQGAQQFTPTLRVDRTFSAKPRGDKYPDYYTKMKWYVAMLEGEAQVIDPKVTAKTFRVTETAEDESVFCYPETASSRAGIDMISAKLVMDAVAIVGLGGTGSYVLDLVAKTPVLKIHLFDGDDFYNHNAFRAPGAPGIELLRQRPRKVHYFRDLYSNMRRGIEAHDYYIDESNVTELQNMNFVFICMDEGEDKRLIVEKLEEWGIPFTDVGMGVRTVNGSLNGLLRVTTSTPEKRDHVWVNQRISFRPPAGNNEYASNIQIADLNALNAALAVIRWKKLFGFYLDLGKEHFCTYGINDNALTNNDKTNEPYN